MFRRVALSLLFPVLLAAVSSCGSPDSQALALERASALDPAERFGEFTRAERWTLHFHLPKLNEGTQLRYEVLVPLLEAEDLPALKVFARAYSQGRGPLGGPQDREKSQALWRRAAGMGDPEAMLALGGMLLHERNLEEATDWLTRSFDASPSVGAAQGLAIAHRDAGDSSRSERWSRTAVELASAKGRGRAHADAEKLLVAALTRGVDDPSSVLERYYRSELRAIETRAKARDPGGLRTLAHVRLGKSAFWRRTPAGSESIRPAEGIGLLEASFAAETDRGQRLATAKNLARFYGGEIREIRDETKAAYWREQADALR